jgi:hypothetical protein
MTTQPISESGMRFGPYPDGTCFHIERSKVYGNVEQGVRIAELLLIRKGKENRPDIWVVEAKSSSPRPETQPNFDAFVSEIRDKLINAFSLGWASCLQRHEFAAAELPEPFRRLNLSETGVRFVLVINGHREEWLPPIKDALNKALSATIKTWAFSPTSVAVINNVMAVKYGLIFGEDGDG